MRRHVLQSIQRVLLAAIVIDVLAIVTLGAHAVWSWQRTAGELSPVGTLAAVTDKASASRLGALATPASVLPGVTLSPENTIGIVAGHWQSDSGAVCDDGLQEIEINLDVAQRVVLMLRRSGYNAEILSEFSTRLDDYRAAALVSIHADACNVPEATGFKVARVSASLVPELEDRLVACLIQEYGAVTGLDFHRSSITYDMTEYHAFYEIAPETPGAIIEIGFMGADRDLLTHKQDRVAQGIVNGIECYLDSMR